MSLVSDQSVCSKFSQYRQYASCFDQKVTDKHPLFPFGVCTFAVCILYKSGAPGAVQGLLLTVQEERMASFLRRRKARFGQSCVAECPTGDISTEDWEDYVLVTVDQKPNATHYLEQPANRHRARSLESSLDSGYEEIHVPPPLAEEDTAVGSGSICSDEAKQVRTSYRR